MNPSEALLRRDLRALVKDLRRQARVDRRTHRKDRRLHISMLHLGFAESAEQAARAIEVLLLGVKKPK